MAHRLLSAIRWVAKGVERVSTLFAVGMVVIHALKHGGSSQVNPVDANPPPFAFRVSQVMTSGQVACAVRIVAWLLLTVSALSGVGLIVVGIFMEQWVTWGVATLIVTAFAGVMVRGIAVIIKPNRPALVRTLTGEKW